MKSMAEGQLLAACRRGDSTAWDELFERHYAATGRFVFQLGYDFTREDVEEICQEVFLSVIQNLASFHGGSQFQTWLFRIAANKARDGGSVAEVRALFDKAAQIDDIKSISGRDIEVTKEGDKVVVSFAYQREIHLAGPAWLTLKYSGRSK